MHRIIRVFCRMRLWNDTRGQDLIEYALLAGFVAVAAAAVSPQIAQRIKGVFSSVDVRLQQAIDAGSST